MKTGFTVVLVVVGSIVVILAIAAAMPQGQGRKLEFSVADIKGDSLGMTLEQYQKKHPESHCGAEEIACIDLNATYAGVPSSKIASFTDSRLYEVTYVGDYGGPGDAVLTALKEKYGEPICVTRDKARTCDWWNGSATIRFSDDREGQSIRFTLDDLAHSASAKSDVLRARQRKMDQ